MSRNGKFYHSRSFAVFRHLKYFRYLRVFFGGDRQEFKDYISLFLCLKETGSRNFEAKYTLGIAGKNRNKEVGDEFPGESFNDGRGTPALLPRADFLDPTQGYLIGGKVNLYYNVSY